VNTDDLYNTTRLASDGKMPAVPPTEECMRRPRRIRVTLSATVHPETLGRLDELGQRFSCHRGQLIDKLVMILHAAYASGRTCCIHGGVCSLNRTDLPAIF